MNNPAIVIAAYNRPNPLRRLLTSISNAIFPTGDIPLHISIDASDVAEVKELADSFEWKHGPKIVAITETHLGLKEHILRCGDLTEQYGAIILLEDDLLVSPVFYDYALKSLNFYRDEEQVAGISLYSYEIAESCTYPFQAIGDGSDVYFMKVASSWGQAWTAGQWQFFRKWLGENGDAKFSQLPKYVYEWGQHSWKKYFINYLIDQDRYFVFPQKGYTTNFEESGTNATTQNLYQVTIESCQKELSLTPFAQSKSVYDVFFELEASALNQHIDELNAYEYEVDLYGIKPIDRLEKKYVLTTRRGRQAELTFSSKMKPLVNNIIYGIGGKEIGLYRVSNIEEPKANPALFFQSDVLNEVNRQVHGTLEVSIVIPVLNFDAEKLKKTLESIPYNRGIVERCIVGSKPVKKELLDWLVNEGLDIGTFFIDTNDVMLLVNEGLKKGRCELQTWVRPGTLFRNDIFVQLPKLFNVFRQVNWISGVEEEVNEKRDPLLNTSGYRWNLHMAVRDMKRSSRVDMEGMFWRKSLYTKVSRRSSFQSENLFYDFLSEDKLYVAACGFVQKNDRPFNGAPDPTQFKYYVKAPLFIGILSRMTYSFFRKNSSPWRLFFVETEHLPDVLRYDFKHHNFYFSRY